MIDVLVVGAGPVGLTLAIALRRLSMSVRVIDADTGANREPRADVIFPRAGEALGAIGVGEAIRQNAYEMRGADFYSDGHRVGDFTVGRFDSRYPVAMTIEQHVIERLLTDELKRRGVDVEWNTRATDVNGYPDHVELSMSSSAGRQEVVSAAWVVGCDGPRSTVRDRLGIAFEGKPRADMQVIQGNVIPSWALRDEPGHGYFFLASRRSVIAFPTPAGGYRIFCVRDDPNPQDRSTPTLGELRDLVAQTAHLPNLELTLTEPVWLSRARFSDRVAAELRHGRVFLAGDAAHSWAPLGGHGMNVGILGAYNLAWKLAAVHHRQATPALLDSYGLEQRTLARAVIRDMRFNVLEMLLPPAGHHARSTILKLTLGAPAFQRRIEWMMSDFGRHHRASPVSWNRGPRGRGLRAGDRIGDLSAVASPAEQSQPSAPLGDLFGYDHWTLLLNAVDANSATLERLTRTCALFRAPIEIVTLTGRDHRTTRKTARAGYLHLVRPDGHVGLVAPVGAVDVLHDYLATFTTAATVR